MFFFGILGMGFRPMNDITAVSITVYNDTASQNNTISSLTNYKNSINIIFRKKKFPLFFI